MPLRLVSGIGAAAGANIGRLFKEAKALYAPGGGFMKGIEAQLARGRKKAVAGGMQSLAAAGLAGTSIAGGLSKKYEEEVAAPAMAQATTTRLSALSNLFAQEASAQLQAAPRYGYQASQSRGGVSTPSRQTAQRRPPSRQLQQQPMPRLQPPTQQLQQQMPSPPTYPKTFAPAGQWQATIGGTGFYSSGTGGVYQRKVPTPSKPLSSYYGSSLNFDPGGELSI